MMTENQNDGEQARDVFCPECNVQTQAKVVATETTAEPVRSAGSDDDVDTPHEVSNLLFAVCKRCGGPFLLEERYYEIPGEISAFQGQRVLYPALRVFEQTGIPETVLRPYREAVQAFSAGLYESCVIMCRKSLEAVCTELGARDGTLRDRIDALRDARQIDEKLAKWAQGLRLLGNDAAHDVKIRIGKEDARDSLDFLEGLLLYAFKLSKQFEDFRARRAGRDRGSESE